MTARRWAAPMAAALAFTATPAVAAPKVYCRLLQSDGTRRAEDDVREQVQPGSTRDYQLVTGDIATNRTHLAAVLRVKSLQSSDPLRAFEGRRFRFEFEDASRPERGYYYFDLTFGSENRFRLFESMDPERVSPAPGVTLEQGRIVELATPAVVVDRKRDEIRMWVPLTAFGFGRTPFRNGTRLTRLYGTSASTTYHGVDGTPLAGRGADVVRGDGRHYPAGARSCLPVGR